LKLKAAPSAAHDGQPERGHLTFTRISPGSHMLRAEKMKLRQLFIMNQPVLPGDSRDRSPYERV